MIRNGNAVIYEPGEKGWEDAWDSLMVDYPDLEGGEGWQYMGTFNGFHHFRNRGLNGRRVDVKFKDKAGG